MTETSKMGIPEGIEVIEQRPGNGGEIIIGKMVVRGKEARLVFFRSPKGTGFVELRLGGIIKWQLDDEKTAGFHGYVRLIQSGKELVLAFVSDNHLIKAYSLDDLAGSTLVKAPGRPAIRSGMRPPAELLDLKTKASFILRMEPKHSKTEELILRARADALAIQEKQAEAELQQKRQERWDRAKLIQQRPEVLVFQGTRKLSGVPVTEAEWMSLLAGQKAILVTSYDPETRACGEVVEAFIVDKRGRDARKKNVLTGLSWKVVRPVDKTFEAMDIITVVFGSNTADIREMPWYSLEGFQEAVASGLNSGTLALVGEPDALGAFAVWEARDGKGKPTKHSAIPIEA